jgi:HD superfamily phosphodiesterase
MARGGIMEKAEVRTWLAVGGLLHDIGKLIDRSGEGRAEEEEKRRFGYSHAVYSYKFLKELLEGKVKRWRSLFFRVPTTTGRSPVIFIT